MESVNQELAIIKDVNFVLNRKNVHNAKSDINLYKMRFNYCFYSLHINFKSSGRALMNHEENTDEYF